MVMYPLEKRVRKAIPRNYRKGDFEVFWQKHSQTIEALGTLVNRTEAQQAQYVYLKGRAVEMSAAEVTGACWIAPAYSKADLAGVDLLHPGGLPIQVKSSLRGLTKHMRSFFRKERNWIPCVVGLLESSDTPLEVIQSLLSKGVYIAKACRSLDWRQLVDHCEALHKEHHQALSVYQIRTYTA